MCVALALVSSLLPLGGAPVSAAPPTELFFSEYIEGSANNKALEIYNGTGAAVLLTGNYSVQTFFSGSPISTLTINLTGTVADGDVFVLAQSGAGNAVLAQADQTSSAGWFNGDDAITLRKGTTVIDAIGQVGFDPGAEWGTGLASTFDNTLQRKSTVHAGDTNASDAFDPALEWDGYVIDTFSGLGSHTISEDDLAPSVSGTTPASGASGVALSANITVDFSEAVDVAGSWFTISCGTSGSHTATVTGSGSSRTLDPDTDLSFAETCTVTIGAGQVSDTDANDPPDTMAANHEWSFTTVDPPFTGCAFLVTGTTMTLQADCTTDSTIDLPADWTLDGAGYTITAVDPEGGHFLGAVVRATGGTKTTVKELGVAASGLDDVCDEDAARLRGILFEGAGGSILDNTVTGINQGLSGCQEGNGIEVRKPPFSIDGLDVLVTIDGNVVSDYQKTGILANGSVNVTVLDNEVTGSGPIDYIAQNGIQVGFGGTGFVRGNAIADNFYTGRDVACGLLFFEAGGVKQQRNAFSGNERDLCNFGRGGGHPPRETGTGSSGRRS